jgi:hypothetical protein
MWLLMIGFNPVCSGFSPFLTGSTAVELLVSQAQKKSPPARSKDPGAAPAPHHLAHLPLAPRRLPLRRNTGGRAAAKRWPARDGDKPVAEFMTIGLQCSDTMYGVVCDVISVVAEFTVTGLQCSDMIYSDNGKRFGHTRRMANLKSPNWYIYFFAICSILALTCTAEGQTL